MEQSESLYERARQILQGEPGMGKQRLADRLGVRTPTSRRLLHRFRGETQGHSNDPTYQKVRKLKDEYPEWGASRTADKLGITVDHAMMHLARWLGAQSYQAGGSPPSRGAPPVAAATPASPVPEAPSGGSTFQDDIRDNARDLCCRSPHIRTLDDLLVYAQVDTRIWEVDRHVINRWEMGTRGPTGEVLTSPLWQIKVWLRRRLLESRLEELFQKLLAEFRKEAPERRELPPPSTGQGLLEVSILDLHLGKLAWGEETRGRDYNADVAQSMFWDALKDLVGKASSFKPAKFLLVVGNDFYNTDILGRTTTAGTVQDEMLRSFDSFAQGRSLIVKAIKWLRERAPVHVVVVSGNHDTQRTYYLGEVLHAFFHNTSGVTIDNGASQRKYVSWNNNLIGFTHGCHEKHQSLPMLMANEQRAAWAAATHKEWHLGHFHSKSSKIFYPNAEHQSILVKVVPSLCPADAWHASMGYSSKLAAEAYYWEDGCVATFSHSPS